mgnify:CR=1 FL=1
MKKTKKIMLWILPLLVVGCLMVTSGVFAANLEFNIDEVTGEDASPTVSNLAGSIWGTISLVAQILAVIAIIFAGVRYMFAGADSKADIKKQTVTLIIGAVLVFGAGLVINLITGVVKDFDNGSTYLNSDTVIVEKC